MANSEGQRKSNDTKSGQQNMELDHCADVLERKPLMILKKKKKQKKHCAEDNDDYDDDSSNDSNNKGEQQLQCKTYDGMDARERSRSEELAAELHEAGSEIKWKDVQGYFEWKI